MNVVNSNREYFFTILFIIFSFSFFSLAYGIHKKKESSLVLYNRLFITILLTISVTWLEFIKIIWRSKNIFLLIGPIVVIVLFILIKIFLYKNKSLFKPENTLSGKIFSTFYLVISAVTMLPFLFYSLMTSLTVVGFNSFDDRSLIDSVEYDNYSIAAYYNIRLRGMGSSFHSVEIVDNNSILKGEETVWKSYKNKNLSLQEFDLNRILISADCTVDTLLFDQSNYTLLGQNNIEVQDYLVNLQSDNTQDRIVKETEQYQYIAREYMCEDTSLVKAVRLIVKDKNSLINNERSLVRAKGKDHFTVQLYEDGSIMAYVHLRDSAHNNPPSTMPVIMHAFDIEDYDNPEIVY